MTPHQRTIMAKPFIENAYAAAVAEYGAIAEPHSLGQKPNFKEKQTARQFVMAYLRAVWRYHDGPSSWLALFSLSHIGTVLGCHHTTVHHGIQRANEAFSEQHFDRLIRADLPRNPDSVTHAEMMATGLANLHAFTNGQGWTERRVGA